MAAASDEAARIETLPGGKERVAGAEVEAARAHEAARRGGVEDGDGVAVAARILLDDDRVGAVRHRRAGEDADRLARRHDAREAAPGEARADDAQRRGRARHVRRAHGVAVHGGSGEGRLRAQGGEVGGERAPVAGSERNVLGGEGLAHACEHPAERFLDGKQAHASAAL